MKLNLKEVEPIFYAIKRTGYYCVWSNAFSPGDLKYDGVVTFQNSYGELPASQIAKLPFYGGLTIVYALISALWAFLYVQHRRDICEFGFLEMGKRGSVLMKNSAGAKLHYSDSDLPDARNANHLGVLRLHEYSWI